MHEWLRISKFLKIKNKLEPEWTNISNEKMSMKYPFCVLKFLYHRINKNSTNSNKCSFLVAAAICKFSDCFKFIMEEPETNANNVFVITYFVTGSISKDHFANQVSQSRHLAGERRETISEQLRIKVLQISIILCSLNLTFLLLRNMVTLIICIQLMYSKK